MIASPLRSAGFRPGPLASRLADARRSGTQFGDPAPDTLPPTVDDAYAVQALVQEAVGGPVGGYKLGLSSPAAIAASGLGHPAIGIMPAALIRNAMEWLEADPGPPANIEVEIAFRLSRALRPGDEARPLADFAASAVSVFEFARSRFIDWKVLGIPALIADGVAFHMLATGSEMPLPELAALADAEAALLHNGKIVATTLPSSRRVDPEQALRLAIPVLLRGGFPTEAGMLITAGNLVSSYDANLSGTFEGWVGERRIECTFGASAR